MFKVNTHALDQSNHFNWSNSKTTYCILEEDPTFCMLDESINYCYLYGEIPINIDEKPIENNIIENSDSLKEVVSDVDTPSTKIVSRGNYNYSFSNDLNLVRNNTDEVTKLTDDERYWLEKLVEAESADEPYDGKLAVANIIINRLKSNLFPNDINEVITAPRQFQPFENGAIYEREASQDSILAISEVFDNGIRVIPNDVFYFMSDTISGNWIDNTRPFYKKIGSHLFFY